MTHTVRDAPGRLGRWALLACMGFLLTACASMLSPRTPEEQVQTRADKRWGLMIKRDFAKAYDYLTPYKRATTTREGYLREMGDGSSWLGYEVTSVTCEQQLCKTSVRLDVASPMPSKFGSKITTHIDEEWVLVDGEWWFSQR
jgi:hypothetical protein